MNHFLFSKAFFWKKNFPPTPQIGGVIFLEKITPKIFSIKFASGLVRSCRLQKYVPPVCQANSPRVMGGKSFTPKSACSSQIGSELSESHTIRKVLSRRTIWYHRFPPSPHGGQTRAISWFSKPPSPQNGLAGRRYPPPPRVTYQNVRKDQADSVTARFFPFFAPNSK